LPPFYPRQVPPLGFRPVLFTHLFLDRFLYTAPIPPGPPPARVVIFIRHVRGAERYFSFFPPRAFRKLNEGGMWTVSSPPHDSLQSRFASWDFMVTGALNPHSPNIFGRFRSHSLRPPRERGDNLIMIQQFPSPSLPL